MNAQPDITVDFAGLTLASPVILASGTCGYADELAGFLDMNTLGGMITKSITLKPRKGNDTPRVVETDSGMLNAIGLANMGLDRFVREKLPIIRNINTAVFVNIAGETIDDYAAVADRLSGEPGLAGFELNISCPNVRKGGITFGTDPASVEQITRRVKDVVGDKPLIVKLTPSVTDITVTARAAVDGGADAISLVNTFTAMVIDIYSRKPVLANRTGGLSGPAIKPVAVYLVNRVYNEVARPAGVPILGGGGIRNASAAIEFMIAGATAVSVGTATFAQPDCAIKVADGIRAFCRSQGLSDAKQLTGTLR
jgi:dihydroorotate dehydrogenase (NAD+) catalytic subunit